MLHFKIVGLTWLVLSLAAAAVFTPQLWSMAADRQNGVASGFHDTAFWISQFSAELFLFGGAVVGIGLFRVKHWAAIVTRVTASLLFLYCLSFVLMSHFRMPWPVAGILGIAFAAYSLFVVFRFRPYERVT